MVATTSYLTAGHREALDTFLKAGAHQIASKGMPGLQAQNVSFSSLAAVKGSNESTEFPVESLAFRNTLPGALEHTGSETGVAVMGGYLMMQDENGEVLYTRNGQGMLNADREWINAKGYRFLDDGGAPITIPLGGKINNHGFVEDAEGNPAARVGVVTFTPEDEQLLDGDVFLRPRPGFEPIAFPADDYAIRPGHIMNSNVSTAEVMAAMMYAQTAREGTLSLSKNTLGLEKEAIESLVKTA